MKAKTIILFALGSIFALGIPSYEGFGPTLVGIGLAAACFYYGWRTIKNKKPAKNIPAVSAKSTPPAAASANHEPYEYLHIKVAGVTFKNGRKSRQSILRSIKFRDGDFSEGIDLELQPYEWEGQPAYGIYANGQQIGNVPADMVGYISENYDRIVAFSAIEVYGGGRDKEGYAKSYGCEVVLKLNK